MNLIPIKKAYDTTTRSSVYVFLCVHRKFPVIIQYSSLRSLAMINDIRPVLSLLEREDFDDFECGIQNGDGGMTQLLDRGYTVSEISRLTDMQPLEIALYHSGLVSADEETMRIMIECTGERDIQPKPLKYTSGEPVRAL